MNAKEKTLCEKCAAKVREYVELNAHGLALLKVADWFAVEMRKRYPNEFNLFAALREGVDGINEEHDRVDYISAPAAEMRNILSTAIRKAARKIFPEQATIILAAL